MHRAEDGVGIEALPEHGVRQCSVVEVRTRPGDIIISTPPKCGTTLTQMMCALLIFDSPAFPGRRGPPRRRVAAPTSEQCAAVPLRGAP